MSTKLPKIAILFLGYNDRDNLWDAITSVQTQTYSNFDIFYLDNASTDNSVTWVKKNFPQIKIIQEKNLGYAGTYAKYLPQIFSQNYAGAVLLNTDIVVSKNWLKNLVLPAFEKDFIASAQPKIYLWQEGKTNKINTFGNPVHFLGMGYCGNYGQEETSLSAPPKNIVYASGCCLLIKKIAFEKIGNLDQDFFMYLEDQDWGIRAHLWGMENRLCENSQMWHKYQFQKNPKNKIKFFYLERNRLFFLFKNYPASLLFLIFPAFLILEIGILFHSILNHYFKEKLLAYSAFFQALPSLWKKRKIVQSQKVLSTKKFFALLDPVLKIENFGGTPLKFANLFFQWYYNLVKKIL